MAVYERCGLCHGSGKTECKSCLCSRCDAQGYIDCKCSDCSGTAMQPCSRCGATGEIVLVKRTIFPDKKGPCPTCNGSGKSTCDKCTFGVRQRGLVCASCQGKRRNSSCNSCRGSAQVECSKCSGAGKFEGDWFKTLRGMAHDQLRFEFEKCQSRIGVLEMKYSELDARHQAIDDQWDEESNHLTSARALRDYQPPSFANVDSAMEEVGAEITKLKEELEAIEKVMAESWPKKGRYPHRGW
jgi:hypothetical protein